VKKIPTLFERDRDGDRSRVIDQVNPKAQWVADGEGVATRKYDGTACMIRDGVLYKRLALTVPEGTTLGSYRVTATPDHLFNPATGDRVSAPAGFVPEQVETSPGRKGPVTKAVGWVPVGDGPEDRYHRDAFEALDRGLLADGTYELLGPKIQGNPEGLQQHRLYLHAAAQKLPDAPRDFAGLSGYLEGKDIEGIVWHHPDGRMAKIKLRDFGLTRAAVLL